MKGMLTLSTTHDLLAKLKHDRDRIEADPSDAYAAYDFFVTAFHMLDWLHPDPIEGDCRPAAAARKQLLDAQPLLAIAGHIANGSKHYSLRDKRWNHVAGFAARIPAFGESLWGARSWAPGAWAGTELVIVLTQEAAQCYSSTTIELLDAANRLVGFWERELADA
jgi:hypothetical protein